VIESQKLVEKRVRKALEVLRPEQLWIDPDCGMKTRTREEAVDKLRVVVEVTKAVRAQLGKSREKS
jgi:5-methyltetrahydropteroyltriglutamate--homocysteine methyltransferase